MKPNKIRAIADRYQVLVGELESEIMANGTSGFQHTTRNLLTFPSTLAQIAELKGDKYDSWNEERRQFVQSIKTLKVYLGLLTKYMDFANAEYNLNVKAGGSIFPDLRSMEQKDAISLGFPDTNHAYVYLAKQRLESRASKTA